MSVSIVNGYVCFNCTDTERAGKGIDPASPPGDTGGSSGAKATAKQPAAGAANTVSGSWSAYADSGSPNAVDPATGATKTNAAGAPLADGVGVRLDAFA